MLNLWFNQENRQGRKPSGVANNYSRCSQVRSSEFVDFVGCFRREGRCSRVARLRLFVKVFLNAEKLPEVTSEQEAKLLAHQFDQRSGASSGKRFPPFH
jgi:hypothetical protein